MRGCEVSRATIGRIPIYLKYLKNANHYMDNISATTIAKELGMGEVQVRKDLGAVSGMGRPKTGYNIQNLIATLENYLAHDEENNVIIAGAGKLGRALLDYGGFDEYGIKITAAFDIAVSGTEYSNSGKPIYPMENMESFCRTNRVGIGVITVPDSAAQEVCNRLIDNGVHAILCFAPCTLHVPDDILVQYENMALSLAFLSKKCNNVKGAKE